MKQVVDNAPLQQLDRLIRHHIEEGRYPGAQIALARNGKLALFRSYGDAKTEGEISTVHPKNNPEDTFAEQSARLPNVTRVFSRLGA